MSKSDFYSYYTKKDGEAQRTTKRINLNAYRQVYQERK
ncbi:MAG: hypothetical protein ACI9J3_003563 [Parvicellaceae bacterium]|jgi:hypothetical protein